MDERRTDTREQIRFVALELFAERGYNGTSLREIAERLGVTKAAVYYHFQTKEDILASLIEDFAAQLDELLTWAQTQPASPDTRSEVLRRYAALFSGNTPQLVRFVQEGQVALRKMAAGLEIRQRFDRLAALLAGPDPSPEEALRGQLGLLALHLGALPAPELGADEAERPTAALKIARELVEAHPVGSSRDSC